MWKNVFNWISCSGNVDGESFQWSISKCVLITKWIKHAKHDAPWSKSMIDFIHGYSSDCRGGGPPIFTHLAVKIMCNKVKVRSILYSSGFITQKNVCARIRETISDWSKKSRKWMKLIKKVAQYHIALSLIGMAFRRNKYAHLINQFIGIFRFALSSGVVLCIYSHIC